MVKLTRMSLIILTWALTLQNHYCVRAQKRSEPVSANAIKPVERQVTISPREILANQPDFVAEEVYASFERAHGHSLGIRVAKKGEWYRRETDIVAVFSSPAEPYVRYILKAKIFDTPPSLRERRLWYENAHNAAILAEEKGVKFEVVGEEVFEGHQCLKIKATKEGTAESDREGRVTVYSYAAKDLQDLVIKTEVLLPDRRTIYVLRNISFDVPDKLFKALARYRRQTSNNGMQRKRY